MKEYRKKIIDRNGIVADCTWYDPEDGVDFDSRFSNNGGSYYQPYARMRVRNGAVLSYRDDSCGDFGTRYSASMYVNGESVASAVWGTMDDVLEFSNIPERICRMFYTLTGVYIPSEYDF